MTILTRTFGVEIEAIFPAGMTQAAIASAISMAGVDCNAMGYTHHRHSFWKVVTDGSLTGGNGQEIVSPVLTGEAGLRQIEKVSEVLLRIGATVNQSCGLHVHVGARSMSPAALRKLAMFYMENELVIDSFMPASRRGDTNYYCKSLRNNMNVANVNRANDAAEIASAITGSRYVKLNFGAYWKHSTVEFRHHSGTVDAAKINPWVKACLRMVDASEREANNTAPATVNTVTGTAAASPRPTNTRLGIIYDMMNAPGGTTREAVAARLGRGTMPPLNRILTEAGIAYEARRNGRTEVYTLRTAQVQQAAPVAVNAEATFENFAARLQMTNEEIQFWQSRRTALMSGATRTHITRRIAG